MAANKDLLDNLIKALQSQNIRYEDELYNFLIEQMK